MSKSRLEAFSDGVFAIVITLLVLDIHIPQDQPLTLASLSVVLPHVLAFVLSFVIVGLYWVAHHSMMHFVKQVDRQILWLNLALLLAVVFVPFPSALLGQHPDNLLAVTLYGTNLMLVNAGGTILWLYATGRPHPTTHDAPPAVRGFIAKLHCAPILVYALAILLANWYVPAGLALFVAVPVFFILPNPFIDSRLRAAAAARGE